MSDSGNRDCRIYIGNLPPDVRTKDVEDLFDKYGKIVFCDLKNRGRGPPFAFLEFDDQRDAEDAVRGRDGYDFDGYRLRVEFPKGGGPRGPGGRHLETADGRAMRSSGGGGYRGGGGGYRSGASGGGDRGGGSAGGGGRRSNYRVLVTGLPPTGSWQDLKDHMREAGDVCYADVFRDGTGVVEYIRYEHMKYALRKLDDTKFRSHEGESSYVRVKEYSDSRGRSGSPAVGRNGHGGGGGRSRSRSPVRRSRGSPTYSPARRSRSRTRSRSRRRSYRRDRYVSASRSPDSYYGGSDRSHRSRSHSGSRSRSRSGSRDAKRSRSRSRS